MRFKIAPMSSTDRKREPGARTTCALNHHAQLELVEVRLRMAWMCRDHQGELADNQQEISVKVYYGPCGAFDLTKYCIYAIAYGAMEQHLKFDTDFVFRHNSGSSDFFHP